MSDAILGFKDQFRFLSNFHPSPFTGTSRAAGKIHVRWNEQWCQVHKTLDPWHQAKIMCAMNPTDCKKFGREAPLRDDWEKIKDVVMLTGLRLKFAQNPVMADLLEATNPRYLEETNHWQDRYWGVCDGYGKNMLGILLMQIRAERTLP